MNDFGAWMQANWYQIGSFLVQLAFLFAAIWFAGKIIKTLRASQEQVGALLKLSVSGITPERHTEPAPLARAASEVSPYWLPPAPSQPTTQFVTSANNPDHEVSSGPGFIGWLKTPMRITTGTSSFHRVLRWFQSPVNT
ncbi:MAG TPA: hypothetical protein VKD70_13345 [Candidatus Acidoferrum sp.]|nr:hypothetical protein [Candidatus Acidoferrum sp.]